MVSESGAIVARLVAAGANYETIGQALGRNRSLVRQVALGVKPGHNLTAALERLEARVTELPGGVDVNRAARGLEVPAPTRRVTGRGHLARVRRPTTISGRAYSTSTIKRQAAGSGGRSLMHTITDAAEAGRRVAVSVRFDRSINVRSYGKSKRGQAGAGGVLDFELGEGDELLDAVDGAESVVAFIVAEAEAAGHISGDNPAAHVLEVELRTF